MHIVVVGVNYRTAHIQIRERFTLAEEEFPQALQNLKRMKNVKEGVIVATCNRTEIYVEVHRFHKKSSFVRMMLEQCFHISCESLMQHVYVYEGEQAVRHLFRVTCGLDSMVLGEAQILGQIKRAFFLAQAQQTTGACFNILFKQAITLGKRVHSQTSIGENAVSISSAAVELGKRIFGVFTNQRVLILGAGKMSELTIKHLYANGASEVIVANRTFEKAEQLAAKYKGTPCTIKEAITRLADVNIVISSTASKDYVLDQALIRESMKHRPSRPLFMIDIGVPRDIQPTVRELSNVFLYDIDDLEDIVQSNITMRKAEAVKIEYMIRVEVQKYEEKLKIARIRPVIQALQQKSNTVHEQTLASLFNKLPELDERQQKLIYRLTRSMMNQMMNDPIATVKQMAVETDEQETIKTFAQIFGLENQLEAVIHNSKSCEAVLVPKAINAQSPFHSPALACVSVDL